ncbi:MAG: site-2 protease family protein [Oscillospiraceae bacterium]|nr:site-2 protease family protein [Oscillospiraceae bacterium]
MSILTIIIAIIIFGLIIAIHEFGHFIAAKLNGVQVNEFAIGMGPKILKFKKGETLYSLRAFPVGGFCSMEGEDTSSENPRAYEKKKIWQRMIIVLAGAFMNIILGFVLLIVTTSMGNLVPTRYVSQLAEVSCSAYGYNTSNWSFMCLQGNVPVSSSGESGLMIGDEILSVNGSGIWTITDLSYKLQTTDENDFTVVVKRGGEKVTLEHVKFENKLSGGRMDFKVSGLEKNISDVLNFSFRDTIATGKLVWMSLGDLITGKYGFHDLSGPVGTISVISEAATTGVNLTERINSLLALTVFITINVGIFNLLPIPGLDGSRFMFMIIEGIRRKPIKKEREAMVHLIGMAVLFLFMIIITVQDVTKFFE